MLASGSRSQSLKFIGPTLTHYAPVIHRLLSRRAGRERRVVRRPRRPSAALGRFVVVAITAIGGSALVSSSVALAAALSHSGHAAPPASQALSSTTAVESAATVSASQLLGTVLQSDYPRSFGGIAIDADQRIAVYMTRVPHSLASVVRAEVPRQPVVLRHSAHSFGTLLAIHHRLARDWINFQSQGIDVVGFHPDVVSSTEAVQVINPSASQVALIEQPFPPRTISVVSVGVAPIPASFTRRVENEAQGAFPWGALPLVVTLEAGVVGLLAYVLVRRRRPAAVLPSP